MTVGTSHFTAMISRSSLSLLISLFPVFAGTLAAAPGGDPDLSVRFGERTIVIAGRIDSEENARTLATAALGARPDLEAVNKGLAVDAAVELPPLSDLSSLITELGLSTQEGMLEIWPDRILIGGLTDSLVTLTALRIRLEPILGGRRFVNHICIVGTEYLPKIDVSLTSRGSQKDPSSINPSPAREQSFEVPGLLVEKLFPTLLMLSHFDRIEGKESASPGTLRALPLEMTETDDGSRTSAEAGTMTSPPLPGMATLLSGAAEAAPVQQYETLPSIFFSRNSFLLQANQEPIIAELTRYLLAPDRVGRIVRIEAVKASGGSSAFNEYLCEKRTAEVLRFLAERGVATAILKPGMIHSSSPVDEGQVTIKVEIPLLPVEPAAAAASDSGAETKSPAQDPEPLPPE